MATGGHRSDGLNVAAYSTYQSESQEPPVPTSLVEKRGGLLSMSTAIPMPSANLCR